MALQNSILTGRSDHRTHHRYVDHDWDPYNIQRGGWWAHILWIFYKNPPGRTFEDVPDLQKNPLVRLQDRYATPIGIVAGLGIPTLIGAAFGDPLGGLLWGGFLRVVVIHHTTFFVNSIAHLYGSRPYTEENSARDNPLGRVRDQRRGVPQLPPPLPDGLPQRDPLVPVGPQQVVDPRPATPWASRSACARRRSS